MYAPAGTDTKHEWIEVCADTATDIDGWKLFEADTNHGLSLVSGVSALAANQCAIIADDATTFATDYPSFNGNLFDSAFSLSNTGETIVLRNADLADIDTVSYTDVLGAKDDGNSLQLQGNAFVATTPTPGTWSGSSSTTDTTTTTATNSGGSTSHQTIVTYDYLSVEPPQDVYLRVEGVFDVMRESNARFVAELYNARGIAETGGNVSWNFGDGTTGEGREVIHRYAHEGTYVLSVRAHVGTLQDAQTYTVTVSAPALSLRVVDDAMGIRIQNNSDVAINLSDWRIVSGGNYFMVPSGTSILPHTAVVFDNAVMKLYQLAVAQQVLLYTPSGALFVNAYEESEVVETVAKPEPPSEVLPEIESISERVASVPTRGGGLVGTRVLPQATVQTEVAETIEPHTENTEPQAPTVSEITPESQVAAVSASNILPDSMMWWAALVVLAVVGVGGVWLARASDTVADGFKIEEL
jgi:hypothetical protein